MFIPIPMGQSAYTHVPITNGFHLQHFLSSSQDNKKLEPHRHEYLVNIVFINGFVELTEEIVQKTDYLQWITAVGQSCEANNIRKENCCGFIAFRVDSLAGFEFISDASTKFPKIN